MQLMLIIEPMEGDPKKFVITPMLQEEADAMHQWQFLQKKRPAIHVEAIKIGGHRIVVKLEAP